MKRPALRKRPLHNLQVKLGPPPMQQLREQVDKLEEQREIRCLLVKPMGAAAERAGQAFDPATIKHEGSHTVWAQATSLRERSGVYW